MDFLCASESLFWGVLRCILSKEFLHWKKLHHGKQYKDEDRKDSGNPFQIVLT
jgi:hypothetical protein